MSYPVGENLEENMPIINEMARLIQEEYDGGGINIWCRGSSGAIVGALIAAQYISSYGGAKVCHVKKDGESSHNHYPNPERDYVNIMVDDFISSGDTVKEIWESQQRFMKGAPMDMMVISSQQPSVFDWFKGKLRKIISN